MLVQRRLDYKWFILILSAATHTFAAALPRSCMPVLFQEISQDLGLNLVQIGTVWGMVSLAGVFVALITGLSGDRFGIKRVLGIACLLTGLFGALRGLSDSFATLIITVFLSSLTRWFIPVNVHNTVSRWFRGPNLGMANGVVAMGMGVGLMLGPMISATVMSPLLGGWRNVLFLYGGISSAMGILWFMFGRECPQDNVSIDTSITPLRQELPRLLRIKKLWYLGLILMFRVASILGMVGYLPLYLRQQGWTVAGADGTLAGFYALSTIAVMPLSILSDRLGSRKALLFPALLVGTIGLILLPLVDGVVIWILVLTMGIFWDVFMALILTMVQETEGVGFRSAGTALGLVFSISQLGAFASPPLGNSLASSGKGLPFIFWGILSAVAIIFLAITRERRLRQ